MSEITLIEMIDMPLHDVRLFENNFQILRVPGGWLYERIHEFENGMYMTTTFVPEVLNVDARVQVCERGHQ